MAVTDAVRPPATTGVRPALVVAVVGSAMAGLVHAAAARAHEGSTLLVWMFILCAAAQVLWAVAVTRRPTRSVLVAGLVINGGAILVWGLTRTVGIPFIDSLADVESVGTQDLAGALFAGASVLGVTRMLAQPVARATIAPAWAGGLAVMALLAALPALRAEHSHEHSDHAHLETAGHAHDGGTEAHAHDESAGHDDTSGHAHDDKATTDEDHEHDSEEAAGDGHEHDEDAAGDLAGHGHDDADAAAPHPHSPTTDGGSHGHPPTTDGGSHPHPPTTGPPHPHPDPDPDDPDPTGPIISLDDPRVTAGQRAVAQDLIDGVSAQLTGKTVASIKAAGYSWIGDGGGGGYQHYVNWAYYMDGVELNPAKIESIVVKDNQIVSGMYILRPHKTMADVPALAGPLTTWHDHQNLCFQGTMLVGLSVNGSCDPAQGGPGGTLTPTPPMLHVWLVPHPCGPFAGIETHGGAGCGHDEH